jgi:anti-sigma factor RsiW
MTPSDEILIQRLLDGELPEPAARALRERLANDPRLRQMASEQRLVTRWFEGAAAGDEASPQARVPVGFAGRVVSRLNEQPFDRPVPVLVFTRRIALAAAVLLAVTLVWHFALSGRLAGGQMQATHDEVKEAVDQLRLLPLPDDVAGRLSTPLTATPDSRPAAPASRAEASGREK